MLWLGVLVRTVQHLMPTYGVELLSMYVLCFRLNPNSLYAYTNQLFTCTIIFGSEWALNGEILFNAYLYPQNDMIINGLLYVLSYFGCWCCYTLYELLRWCAPVFDSGIQDVLLLKATSQAALNSVKDCLALMKLQEVSLLMIACIPTCTLGILSVSNFWYVMIKKHSMSKNSSLVPRHSGFAQSHMRHTKGLVSHTITGKS